MTVFAVFIVLEYLSMINLKTLENLMKSALNNKDVNLSNAYRELIKVFRFKDAKERVNHCRIIEILYNSKNKKYTKSGIAKTVHISDNTLRRYRKNYANWFNYLLEVERGNIDVMFSEVAITLIED